MKRGKTRKPKAKATFDFHAMETKWQTAWQKARLFEANADKRKKKFFINFPYPYVNAFLHLGHGFSATRVDVMARFRRMQGYNVLFPQAWHCTGTPITAAAQRVKEKEPKQIAMLKEMGFSSAQIEKFSNPVHWTRIFPEAATQDFKRLGASVDWRRSFITTHLNQSYDKFIAWQFSKLREKGYVVKGKHAVVWCPRDQMPIGDHDRVEGEGETPVEFTLLKFRLDNEWLVAATLRPETVFGETNFWVNPDVEYVKAKINDETWIVSKECAVKLGDQGKKVEIVGKVAGRELIGKYCIAPFVNRKLPILPAKFCDPAIGTGLVTSVPSDAPYDWIALKELQENEAECKKFGLKVEEVKKIKPVAIIETAEWGELPALKIVQDWKIASQTDKRLEEATQAIYKASFYSGKMKANCFGFEGMSVEAAKAGVKAALAKKGLADTLYELSGKVVCRCLAPAIVRVVSDQWFLKYSDPEWKKTTRKALAGMSLYPETIRQQFEYVLGWLGDWACTHHHGLGSYLPWDKKWVIEALSDSTIYMAYYTFAHLIKDIPAEKLNVEVFDYLLLGKGKKPNVKNIDKMREEFEYWYPFDMRSTAKDLVQNHMAFCLFNHTAIFPEKYWPKAYSVNGWLLVQGQKMSKSKGNFYTIRQILGTFPADVVRTALMIGGEGLDDPNFDFNSAEAIRQKLKGWWNFALANYNKGEKAKGSVEEWFESAINKTIKDATAAMEQMMFRTALEKAFFEMQKHLKWYLKRKPSPNKKLLSQFIEIQTKLLAPFTPHIAEEIWHSIRKKSFISLESWPAVEEKKIKPEAEKTEKAIEMIIDDIRNILNLVGARRKIYIYAIPKELALYSEIKKFLEKEFNAAVTVYAVNDPKRYDPQQKAGKARPGKPAIYVE